MSSSHSIHSYDGNRMDHGFKDRCQIRKSFYRPYARFWVSVGQTKRRSNR